MTYRQQIGMYSAKHACTACPCWQWHLLDCKMPIKALKPRMNEADFSEKSHTHLDTYFLTCKERPLYFKLKTWQGTFIACYTHCRLRHTGHRTSLLQVTASAFCEAAHLAEGCGMSMMTSVNSLAESLAGPLREPCIHMQAGS